MSAVVWAVLAFLAGAVVGVMLMAVLVSGRDPAEVRREQRKAGHW